MRRLDHIGEVRADDGDGQRYRDDACDHHNDGDELAQRRHLDGVKVRTRVRGRAWVRVKVRVRVRARGRARVRGRAKG